MEIDLETRFSIKADHVRHLSSLRFFRRKAREARSAASRSPAVSPRATAHMAERTRSGLTVETLPSSQPTYSRCFLSEREVSSSPASLRQQRVCRSTLLH